jgi:hypothetical protein
MFLTKSSDIGLRRFEIDAISYITRLVRLAFLSLLQAWQLTAEYLGMPVEPVWAAMDGVDTLDN